MREKMIVTYREGTLAKYVVYDTASWILFRTLVEEKYDGDSDISSEISIDFNITVCGSVAETVTIQRNVVVRT